MTAALLSGVRRAWLAWALTLCLGLLAYPAFRDLERLFIGLAVCSALVALAITGFTAAAALRPEKPAEKQAEKPAGEPAGS